jgi:glycosyltransferase involved in cell wall biosynthesis
MYEYLKIFVRLGYKIVFWPDNLNRSTPYTEELQQMGIEVIYGNNDFDEYMKRFGKYFELAYLCRATVAIKYIDVIKKYKNIKIIYDTHDLCFLRELRRAELEKRQELLGSAMNLKSIELYLASLSDTVVVVSQIEQDILLQENSRLNVKLLPAVYRVQSNRSEFDKRNGLLFIGGFAHIPNVDGIIWFTHKIFPKIVMGQPDIKLYIVGSNPPEEVLKLSSENVVVTGYVRDVEPFFLNSRVFIAPLRYGAGIKGKILQSMSYGLPVVTTSIGAEGMPLTNTEMLLIADDETDFAEKVTGLYFDRALWKELSQNSTEYMAANFTPEVCEIKFRELLDFK